MIVISALDEMQRIALYHDRREKRLKQGPGDEKLVTAIASHAERH